MLKDKTKEELLELVYDLRGENSKLHDQLLEALSDNKEIKKESFWTKLLKFLRIKTT